MCVLLINAVTWYAVNLKTPHKQIFNGQKWRQKTVFFCKRKTLPNLTQVVNILSNPISANFKFVQDQSKLTWSIIESVNNRFFFVVRVTVICADIHVYFKYYMTIISLLYIICRLQLPPNNRIPKFVLRMTTDQ